MGLNRYSRRLIQCVLAALSVLTISGVAPASEESHSSADLQCPEININTLTGRHEFELRRYGLNRKKIALRFLWDGNEQGPQLSLQSELFEWITVDTFRFFDLLLKGSSLPAEINIVQTKLGPGIGALYCRSSQREPSKSVTLFMSAKTLESTNEFMRLIAHELTHHWFLLEGKQAATWIEEGVAYLVEYLMTGRLSGSPIAQYLSHSGASLTQTDPNGPLRQMGHAQLLFVYLHEKLGDRFLTGVLSSEMNDIKDLDLAIPKDNDFGWLSFHDAFRDFQIAKFLNRQDYLANTDTDRDRYFLFPTTLQATSNGSSAAKEWSGQEYRQEHTKKAQGKPAGIKHIDLLVIDDPSQPISVKPITQTHKASGQLKQNERLIRVFYGPRL